MRPVPRAVAFAMLVLGCGDNAGPAGYSLAVTTRPAANLAAGIEHELEVVVRLTDDGDPVVGAAASWASETAGDSIVAESQTDADGYARGTWYIGPFSGQHTLTVGTGGTEAATIETGLKAFQPEELSAGAGFACGTRDGEVWCWGHHPDALVPVRVAAAWPFVDVEVETSSACGLTVDGAAVCWDETTMVGGTPAAEIVGASALVQLAITEGYVCGLTAAGQPWCSGPKYPANGTEITGAPPLWRLAAADESFDDMTACGLSLVDSTAWCWGNGGHGSMGNGTSVASYDVAQQVNGGMAFTDIAGSSYSFCAIQLDQNVACWGYGGALPGFGNDQPEPTTFSNKAVFLSGGWLGYLGISPDGPAFWGGYLEGTDADSTFEDLDGVSVYELGDAPCIIQESIGASCSIGFRDGFHRWQRLRPFVPVPDPELVH